MLELINQTSYAVGIYPGWDSEGNHQMTCVVKISHSFDEQGGLELATEPVLIEECDRYAGDPETTSLEVANESMPFKQGGELLVFGTAKSTNPNITAMEVSVALQRENENNWQKTLRIFGERCWEGGMVANLVGMPQALQSVPLKYEYAFGGEDLANKKPPYSNNPAGMGYSSTAKKMKGVLIPQIEHGQTYISSPSQKPMSAGFGPIAPTWEPRISLYPQIDNHDITASPYGKNPPPNIHNVAPQDQQFDRPFVGAEVLTLLGFYPENVALQIPKNDFQVDLFIGETAERLDLICDTVIVDTDAKTLQQIYRVGIPWEQNDPRTAMLIISGA